MFQLIGTVCGLAAQVAHSLFASWPYHGPAYYRVKFPLYPTRLPMSAEIQQSEQMLDWRASLSSLGQAPGAELAAWLECTGLLTMRLKRACAGGFRLQLLNGVSEPGLMIDDSAVRRVVLWCNDEPCVYAESCLSGDVLQRIPGLRRLGTDPLGETLQSYPGVSRGAFEFAVLEAPALPAPLSGLGGAPLWARRSAFDVGGAALTVAEVFLPAIAGYRA